MLSKHTLAALVLAPLLGAALPAPAAVRYAVTALPAGTTPSGINNSGQIVGDFGSQGFSWTNGTLVQFGAMGGSFASARAVNNGGAVAGYAELANGDVQAFSHSAGVTSPISVFGAPAGYGVGINDLGQIAGQYFSQATGTRAYLYSGGAALDLGDLGGGFAAANAVNNAGHVVGFSALDDAPFHAHAFFYADGVMRDLGAFPDASLSEATAINELDQVTGHGWVGGSFHAFLYQDGALSDLGTLGGRESFAYDINSLGQIVGYSDTAGDLQTAAYLWDAGVMLDLNSLIDPAAGWTLFQASGINDRGQIAAYGCRDDECGGVLLDIAAVPEPGSVLLLALGLGLLGWRRGRASAACRRG
jgi:probable HAF family extracellular repeat protein